MIMVDTLFSAGSDSAETGLAVSGDNVFCLDGCLIEPGIIEHSAQSAAAFSGYRYFEAGEEPRIDALLRRKLKSDTPDRAELRKAADYLYRRGFGRDEIHAALARYCELSEED